MKVVRPTELADSMLVSTSAVNADADYNPATAYAIDARCTYKRRVWQSLQAANAGHAPDMSVAWWVDQGPCNQWAMFDKQISTSTTATDSLTFTVATGIIDTVVLVAVTATSAHLVVRDGLGGPIIYDKTAQFSGDVPTDWYQYFFFDPLNVSTQSVFSGIPPYASSHATVTLSSGGPVAIGVAMFGLLLDFGQAQHGATAGIIDYSRKEKDEFGITTFVERDYSKNLSIEFLLDKPQMNRVQRLLYGVRAKPCFWIATDDPAYEEALSVYGFYRNFSATIAYPTYSLYSLEIEGLS